MHGYGTSTGICHCSYSSHVSVPRQAYKLCHEMRQAGPASTSACTRLSSHHCRHASSERQRIPHSNSVAQPSTQAWLGPVSVVEPSSEDEPPLEPDVVVSSPLVEVSEPELELDPSEDEPLVDVPDVVESSELPPDEDPPVVLSASPVDSLDPSPDAVGVHATIASKTSPILACTTESYPIQSRNRAACRSGSSIPGRETSGMMSPWKSEPPVTTRSSSSASISQPRASARP